MSSETGGRKQQGALHILGDRGVLDQPLLGFFSSIRCPGAAIVRTYDAARELRDAGVPVVGGFHSPMEKECLDLFLRGRQPVVVCPARSLSSMRLPAEWKKAIRQGRLVLASAFDQRHRRATAELAERRNRLVAQLASEILIAYASLDSKTWRLCQELLEAGRRILTLDIPDNQPLLGAGAIPFRLENIPFVRIKRSADDSS